MRCPICNTENPAEAASCQQCGFALGLEQSIWPDQESVTDELLDDEIDLGEAYPAGLRYPLPAHK